MNLCVLKTFKVPTKFELIFIFDNFPLFRQSKKQENENLILMGENFLLIN